MRSIIIFQIKRKWRTEGCFRGRSIREKELRLELFDDQFLYFKGTSEYMLDKISIDGTKLIKEKLTKEEEEYKIRNTYNDKEKDRGILRPDIFLYPEEGNCVIIEFKAPEVDVSDYLDQITLYASLINNLSDDKFKIHTFQ